MLDREQSLASIKAGIEKQHEAFEKVPVKTDWTVEEIEEFTLQQFADAIVIKTNNNGSYRWVLSHYVHGKWVYSEYCSMGSIIKGPTDWYLIDYALPNGLNLYTKRYDGVDYEPGCEFGRIKEKFVKGIDPLDTYGTWSLNAGKKVDEKEIIKVAFEMWKRRMKRKHTKGFPDSDGGHFEAYCSDPHNDEYNN